MERNRREHQRVTVQVPIQFVVEDQDVVSCPTIDIGQGGLGVHRVRGLPLGIPFKMFVPVPNRRTGRLRLCLVHGEVVWRTDTAMGVQFIDLPSDTQKQLDELVGINWLG
jgi:hypothetical protein